MIKYLVSIMLISELAYSDVVVELIDCNKILEELVQEGLTYEEAEEVLKYFLELVVEE